MILQDSAQILLIILLVKLASSVNYDNSISNAIILTIVVFVYLTMFISILMWIGVVAPTHIIQLANANVKSFYGIFNYSEVMLGQIARVAGPFDEPGQFVFIIWHCIILNELTTKNKHFKFVLIIGGIFTFSFAHYVCLLLIALSSFFSIKNLTKNILIILLMISIFIFSYQYSETIAKVIDYAFLGRIDINSGAPNIASNRFQYTYDVWELTKNTPLLGAGRSNVTVVAANYADVIYTYGLLTAIILALPVVFLCSLLAKNGYMGYAIILFLLYLQRPQFFQVINMFLIFLMMNVLVNRRRYSA